MNSTHACKHTCLPAYKPALGHTYNRHIFSSRIHRMGSKLYASTEKERECTNHVLTACESPARLFCLKTKHRASVMKSQQDSCYYTHTQTNTHNHTHTHMHESEHTCILEILKKRRMKKKHKIMFTHFFFSILLLPLTSSYFFSLHLRSLHFSALRQSTSLRCIGGVIRASEIMMCNTREKNNSGDSSCKKQSKICRAV